MIDTIVISNVAEAFIEFLSRSTSPHTRARTIRDEVVLEERGILWKGDNKIVITSSPIDVNFVALIKKQMSYRSLYTLTPGDPSGYLSKDILADGKLINSLVNILKGRSESLNLISYVATPEIYKICDLLKSYGLKVSLPESPQQSCLWIRDQLDTKIGFRDFVKGNSGELEFIKTPESFFCEDIFRAAAAASWFIKKGKNCICKPNKGEGGIGCILLRADDYPERLYQSDLELVLIERLQANNYLIGDWIIVEEYIELERDVQLISPSVEIFIPFLAPPQITHVHYQVLHENTAFFGTLSDPEIENQPFMKKISADSLRLAMKMQSIGYSGVFDIDFIIKNDVPFVLEANMRRTGSTHMHEAAERLFGIDYNKKMYLSSIGWHDFGKTDKTFQDIRNMFSKWIYPIAGQKLGIIFSTSACIPRGYLSYFIVGRNPKEIELIQKEVEFKINNNI